MVNCGVGGLAAVTISIVFGWRLGLAILATAPILYIAGTISMKLHTGDQKKDTRQSEKAGNVSFSQSTHSNKKHLSWIVFSL
jgi:hypothetical protein